MNGSDPVKQAWQASAAEPALPDIAKVRAGADAFYRRIRRRNAIEYSACVLVVICFSAYVLFLPSAAARIGAAMIVVGTLVVAWQLHARASAVPPPDGAAAEPILVHQRAQLARQRDALAGVFTWYLLPLIPGLLVMLLARALDHGMAGLLHMPGRMWAGLIFPPIVFVGVWLLNQRAARRLEKRVAEIDKLIGAGQ